MAADAMPPEAEPMMPASVETETAALTSGWECLSASLTTMKGRWR